MEDLLAQAVVAVLRLLGELLLQLVMNVIFDGVVEFFASRFRARKSGARVEQPIGLYSD